MMCRGFSFVSAFCSLSFVSVGAVSGRMFIEGTVFLLRSTASATSETIFPYFFQSSFFSEWIEFSRFLKKKLCYSGMERRIVEKQQRNQAAFAFHKSVDVKKIVVKEEIVVDNKIRQIFLFVDAIKKARVGIKKFCGMSF